MAHTTRNETFCDHSIHYVVVGGGCCEDSKGEIARRGCRDGPCFGATGHSCSGCRGKDSGPYWRRVMVVVVVVVMVVVITLRRR